MSEATTLSTRAPSVRERRKVSVRRHPERWIGVVAVGGWVVLAGHAVLGRVPGVHAHGAHTGAMADPMPMPASGSGDVLAALGPHVLAGVAMIAAMAPLLAPNARYAAMRSPAAARGAVTVEVVAGWALVWAGAMAALSVLAEVLDRTVGVVGAVVAVTVVALVWQHTAAKRRSVARCHALLAPPLDRRASRARCLRHGRDLGLTCVTSCWALMALMAVSAHDPVVIASTMGVAWYERRRRPHHDQAPWATSAVVVLAGVSAVVLVLLTGPSAHG